jgi:hypothetical protein
MKPEMPEMKEREDIEMKEEKEELQELRHEAVPGYRTAFFIVMAVATLYLAVILFDSI